MLFWSSKFHNRWANIAFKQWPINIALVTKILSIKKPAWKWNMHSFLTLDLHIFGECVQPQGQMKNIANIGIVWGHTTNFFFVKKLSLRFVHQWTWRTRRGSVNVLRSCGNSLLQTTQGSLKIYCFLSLLNYSGPVKPSTPRINQSLQHGSRLAGLPTIPYRSVRAMGTCWCRNLPAGIKDMFAGTNCS